MNDMKYYEKKTGMDRVMYINTELISGDKERIQFSLDINDIEYDISNKEIIKEFHHVKKDVLYEVDYMELEIKEKVCRFQVDKIVFDSRGVGLIIPLKLSKETYDNDSKRVYPAYRCINNIELQGLCTCKNKIDILYDVKNSIYRYIV